MGPFPELGARPHVLDAKCRHLCTAKEAEETRARPKHGTPMAPWHRPTAPPPAASVTPPHESQQTHLVPPCDSAGAVLVEPRCSLSCLAQLGLGTMGVDRLLPHPMSQGDQPHPFSPSLLPVPDEACTSHLDTFPFDLLTSRSPSPTRQHTKASGLSTAQASPCSSSA